MLGRRNARGWGSGRGDVRRSRQPVDGGINSADLPNGRLDIGLEHLSEPFMRAAVAHREHGHHAAAGGGQDLDLRHIAKPDGVPLGADSLAEGVPQRRFQGF
jgi:hypothetical protein